MAVTARLLEIIGVLALLVLVAWAPAYYAQQPAERALADGDSFTVRAPHIGDRLVQELVVTVPGHDSLRIGPIGTWRIREPSPGEAPVASTYVLEEVRHAGELQTALGVYQHMGSRTLRFYDNDHRPIWRDRAYHEDYRRFHAPDAPPGATIDDREACGFCTPRPLDDVADVVRYQPEDAFASFARIWTEDPEDGPALEGHDGPAPTAVAVAVAHPDEERESNIAAGDGRHILYGWNPTHTNHGRHSPYQRSNEVAGFTSSNSLATATSTLGYDWFVPDFPFRVGWHLELHDANGTRVITIDVVPQLIERGHRPAVPEEDRREDTPFLSWPIPDARFDDARTTLGALQQDDGVLHRGFTIIDLRRIGAEAAPSAGIEEASLVGFAWHDRTDIAQATNWTLAWLAPNGTSSIQTLTIVGDATAFIVTEAAWACGKPIDWANRGLYGACPAYPIGEVDALGPFILPSVALDALRTNLPATEAPPAWTSGAWVIAIEERREIPPDEGHGSRTVIPFWPARGHHHHLLSPLTSSAALGHHEAGTGWQERTMDATGGGMLSDVRLRYDDAPRTIAAAEITASETHALVQLAPTGAVVGFGAALIAGIVGMLRGVLVVARGGHLGLLAFLYARVTRDDAVAHERRRRLLDLVSAEPGIHMAAASRRVRIPQTAAIHHLETLVRTGHLTKIIIGRHRHYFRADAEGGRAHRRRLAVQHHDGLARILAAVERAPGAPVTTLASLCGTGKGNASRQVKGLEALGLVTRERNGRLVTVHPTHPPTEDGVPGLAPESA